MLYDTIYPTVIQISKTTLSTLRIEHSTKQLQKLNTTLNDSLWQALNFVENLYFKESNTCGFKKCIIKSCDLNYFINLISL